MLEQLGVLLVSRATGAAIAPLVTAFLDVQQQQRDLLRSIQHDLTALREGPWHESGTYLEDFRATSDSRFLDRAVDALRRALGTMKGTAAEAAIAANLALAYELQGRRGDAARWALGALDRAEEHLASSARDAQAQLRAPVSVRGSLRERLLNVTPPTIEWLWWLPGVTTGDQVPALRRKVGSQAYFVPLRLRLRPAIEAGVRLPDEPAALARALGLDEVSWLEAKTVRWTLQLPAIQRLYAARAEYTELADYAALCGVFGKAAAVGEFRVDLSTQRGAVVEYAGKR